MRTLLLKYEPKEKAVPTLIPNQGKGKEGEVNFFGDEAEADIVFETGANEHKGGEDAQGGGDWGADEASSPPGIGPAPGWA